jgi:hypothetical protein
MNPAAERPLGSEKLKEPKTETNRTSNSLTKKSSHALVLLGTRTPLRSATDFHMAGPVGDWRRNTISCHHGRSASATFAAFDDIGT